MFKTKYMCYMYIAHIYMCNVCEYQYIFGYIYSHKLTNHLGNREG